MADKEKLKHDELLLKILVKPGEKVNFEKVGILMVQESTLTGNVYAVESATYKGDGIWETDKKFQINVIKKDKE